METKFTEVGQQVGTRGLYAQTHTNTNTDTKTLMQMNGG